MSDNRKMSEKYPQYYKHIPVGITEADTYVINKMFPIDSNKDPTGTVLHARKKLLIPGCRSGGKSFYDDIREARDTLTRYLELMGIEQGSRSFDSMPKAPLPPVMQPKTFETAPVHVDGIIADFGAITSDHIKAPE